MSVDSYRCAGSDVLADGPYWDFKAVCPACFQLVQVRPADGSYRFLPHDRAVAVDPAEDAMWVPEFNERGAA